MKIKVLGSECPDCKLIAMKLLKLIKELKINASVEEVTDLSEIERYNIMSTPGLVIDEKLVSYGKVPDSEELTKLLMRK